MRINKSGGLTSKLISTPNSTRFQNTSAVPSDLIRITKARTFQPISILGIIGSALLFVSAEVHAVDTDGDGVDDVLDNCTNVANPD